MEVAEPVTVVRYYTQKLRAAPDVVFPLLCPVRELEWVSGWSPLVVFTATGLMEPDCIFITGESEPESYWVVTRHDPKSHHLEMIKVTPGMTVGKIAISLKANSHEGTDAEVTYRYTAISQAGQDFVDSYTWDFFTRFMQQWESSLNAYLENTDNKK